MHGYIYIDRPLVHVPDGSHHHSVDDIYIAPGGRDATLRQLASMPAQAHRRAPGHLAGADPPSPSQAVRRTGESLNPPYLFPRGGGLSNSPPRGGGFPYGAPYQRSRPLAPLEGAPGPRAPRSAARFARRLRLPSPPLLSFTCPPPRPPVRPTPPPRQLAPHAPLPRAAKHRRPPLVPGLGERGPPVAHGCVGTGVPGVPTARVTLPGPPP